MAGTANSFQSPQKIANFDATADEMHQECLVDRIEQSLAGKEAGAREELLAREVCFFYKINKHLGSSVADAFGLPNDETEMTNLISRNHRSDSWTGKK